MVNKNAQDWLNEKYPINGVCQRNSDQKNKGRKRSEITELDISKGNLGKHFYSTGDGDKNLVGSLKIEGFTNLRTLICSGHELIGLDVSECPNLEELDCQSNQLNNLNVNGCFKLKNIDCLNNNLNELDLLTCPKLEEVNIKKCPKLDKNTIKSNLTYDKLSEKLVKGSSQIISVGENDVRNILIIGITGNGKSALANVLADTSATNYFKEKSSSTSSTKNFKQSEIFEYQGKKYRIIDNIGFGDTNNISEKDILFEIGKGIYSAKEGINQVLFVFKDRFSPEQITVYNMFKNFIAETGITRFTTLVRTNFENFRSQEKCQEDKSNLFNQSKGIAEVVSSCNGIIYVDNPAVPVVEDSDSESEKLKKNKQAGRNEKKRKESREKMLNHLIENCQEVYKLKEWESIHDRVAEYMRQIKEKQKNLARTDNISEKNRLQKEIKDAKNKVADEVNVVLTAEISTFPKLIAQVGMKNPNFWPFNKK